MDNGVMESHYSERGQNARAWEHMKNNKTKRGASMEKVKLARKKEVPTAYITT